MKIIIKINLTKENNIIEISKIKITPTTGIGPGIERMAMIFTEQRDIYDVIFFPMMKPVLSEANRVIYGLPPEPQAPPPGKAG